MTDYRKENKYILSFSDKFCIDFDIDKDNFVLSVKRYIKDFYLTSRPQMYSLNMLDYIIRFHKIDMEDNNKSSQKWKRIIVFFLLNTPQWINTIYPAFAFKTQEEKIYNKKLKEVDFVKSLRLKLEKYNIHNENNIEI